MCSWRDTFSFFRVEQTLLFLQLKLAEEKQQLEKKLAADLECQLKLQEEQHKNVLEREIENLRGQKRKVNKSSGHLFSTKNSILSGTMRCCEVLQKESSVCTGR